MATSNEPAPPAHDHESDEDCAGHLDAHGFCQICGVFHDEPCIACGGRGFHRAGCKLSDEYAAAHATASGSEFEA